MSIGGGVEGVGVFHACRQLGRETDSAISAIYCYYIYSAHAAEKAYWKGTVVGVALSVRVRWDWGVGGGI